MYRRLSRIQSVSNWAALPTKASTAKIPTQTAATFSRKGTRAEASWSRSQASPIAVRPLSGDHSWVVRSRPYHSSENDVSVPSACISATIASTASYRLSEDGSALLSKPTASGS